jgi:hypothetical protein
MGGAFMFKHKGIMASLAAACLFSCGGPEQRTIDTFFEAIEIGDEQARAAVSTVDFPGEVGPWEITEVVSESTEPFALPGLRQKAREANTEVDFHAQKMGNFQSDHKPLFQQYQARIKEDPDYEFEGELAEFKEEYDKLLEEEKRLKQDMADVNRQMETERVSAAISLMGSSVSDQFDGDVSVMEVLVRVNDRPYKFILREYNLINQTNQSRPLSRWVITDIQEQSD